MQLNVTTLAVLKNLATINGNLVIREGKSIKTISSAKDIMVEFNGDDEFEKKLSIFNLNEFLGVLSAFEKPELTLGDKSVTISQGKQKVTYVYADEIHLVTPPAKTINFPGADITLTLTGDMISKLMKMSGILAAEDLAIVGDGEKVVLKVYDKRNPSNNIFEIETDVETEEEFNVNLRIEKLKLIPGTYKVELTKKISKFTNNDLDLVYYIAIEADSVFPS